MKFFVTGGSGFIGSAVVDELVSHGHQVVGLARSEESAAKLEKAGAEVIKGGLEDLDALKKGARESDGILHLGFIHDFTKFAHSCKVDEAAIDTFISELEGTNKPFIYTAGLAGLQHKGDSSASETDVPVVDTSSDFGLRTANELKALKSHSKGIRSMVMRLPPTVHGAGDQGFVTQLINIADKKKVSYYIGEGQNIWPAIHRRDAAVLYRLAAEKGVAGAAYHAVHENLETKKIAGAIGKILDVPVESIEPAKATEALGFFGIVFALNVRVSNEKTLNELGPWAPKEIALLDDIQKNYKVSDAQYMKF